MSRKLCFVLIPYDNFREFETFLYEQVGYPTQGFVRYVSSDNQVYVLDLEESEAVMITLRFQGAKVDPFTTSRGPPVGTY
jgi:hypothetical protein